MKRSGLAWVAPELREHRGEIEAAADRRAAAPGRAGRCPWGPSHAHDGQRWPRRSGGDGGARRSVSGYGYAAITEHSQALAMANGLDEQRALEHARTCPGPERALRGPHPAGGHRVRHPAGRAPRSCRRLPRPARLRDRLGAFAFLPGRGADDRSDPPRIRVPLGRRARPSDRPAAAEAGAAATAARCRSQPRHAAMVSRWRSTARPLGWTSTTRTHGWRATVACRSSSQPMLTRSRRSAT